MDWVTLDGARHAAWAASAPAELRAGDGDDLDAGLGQAFVRVDVALVGDDDTGCDGEHVVAVVPLLALGLVVVAAGGNEPQARQVESPGDGGEQIGLALDLHACVVPGLEPVADEGRSEERRVG